MYVYSISPQEKEKVKELKPIKIEKIIFSFIRFVATKKNKKVKKYILLLATHSMRMEEQQIM